MTTENTEVQTKEDSIIKKALFDIDYEKEHQF